MCPPSQGLSSPTCNEASSPARSAHPAAWLPAAGVRRGVSPRPRGAPEFTPQELAASPGASAAKPAP